MESNRTDPKIAKMAFEAVYADKIDINRRLHEALGRCWHEYDHWEGRYQVCRCGVKHFYHDEPVDWDNPDYCKDPRLVIEAMREEQRVKSGDWHRFCDYISCNMKGAIQIDIHLIMNREGKLALLAIGWIEGRK